MNAHRFWTNLRNELERFFHPALFANSVTVTQITAPDWNLFHGEIS